MERRISQHRRPSTNQSAWQIPHPLPESPLPLSDPNPMGEKVSYSCTIIIEPWPADSSYSMAKYVFFLYTLLVSIVHIWTLGLYVEGIRDIDIVDVCHRSCETDLRYTSEGGSELFCDQSCSVQQ
ncbi:proto-oncogene tyrosine-protein kinase ROS, partial [Biomphalaria pfeifferi]